MDRLLVSLIVEETYLIHFSEIVESCKAAGMDVQRQMTTIGVISGTIDASRVTMLSQIQGVHHVEKSHNVAALGKPLQK